MALPQVVHFELAADNPDRATTFYHELFGWKVEKWGGGDYWLLETGTPGDGRIGGAVMPRKNAVANVINTVAVEDIDAVLAKVTGLGGAVLTDKNHIPGVGLHAYCRDTEGNVFGILQVEMQR